jgi:predicted porin
MKKTLIAAAVAASFAAPAMADVSVSGQVKVTYASVENGADMIDHDNALTFKASEDLGNGLSAFAQITLDTDGTGTGLGGHKDQKVGVKGAFGTLVLGRMESITEGVISAKFDDGKSDHGAVANTGDITQLESGATKLGRGDAMAYISPTINGVHVAVAAVSSADDNGYADYGKDYAIFYDNGPLSLGAAQFDGGTNFSNNDVTSMFASYTMGDAKLTVGNFDKDNGDEATIYRLDYKLGGGNSLLVGYRDGEKSDGTKSDVTSIKLTHSFSKRTAVWVGFRDRTQNTTDSQVGHAGLIHKF